MIELFFDFVSPYSYLAARQVRALGARVGREVVPRPALLAAILDAAGTKGPAEVPAKRAYVVKDWIRAAHRAGVKVALPPCHPFNPLVALRVAGLDGIEPELRWAIVDALFVAAWENGASIEGPGPVASVLRGAGLDDGTLLALASTDEAKARLRASTGEAVARGAFGLPTLFADGEMFFGADSLFALEAFCRGEDPVAERRDLLEEWARIPASAQRKSSA